jgi:hypothetical protein
MAKHKRNAQPAPGAAVVIRVEAVPPEGIMVIRWLGSPRGILVHWVRKAGIACPGPDECKRETHRSQTRWKGFASAEYWRSGQYQDWCPCAFEVTSHLAELIEGAILRGTIWTMQRRASEGKTKEVVGEQTGEVDPDALRPAFSIEPAVCRVYGTPHILFDVEPYLPRPLMMPASAGAPPANMIGIGEPCGTSPRSATADYRQMILDGTLPDAVRKAVPRLIAKIEAELSDERVGEHAPTQPQPLPVKRPPLPEPGANGTPPRR